ncbi:CCA tRNA nucleotidyltransferase [Ileibacterium valens]|uniref:CCA tRNA nucleotidyltransferase n=1 Tax=Ileibacterium valens TaxID=1862668 RepID=UPI00235443B8|nr:tRNA nucleotidyltransferase [Ileibacterium valens]
MKEFQKPEFRIPEPIIKVMKTLEQAGYQVYLVGGCVRDLLMQKTPHDYDLATDARPEEILKLFEHHSGFGMKHGTILVVEQGMPVEITTFRKEGKYTDGRHPDEVIFVDRIEEDLGRRDFTINAMAYHPDQGLIDPYGGRNDLEKKLIRAVGDPDQRFQEDALRMLRAWRFASTYGFDIEPETRKALDRKENIAQAATISAERVMEEFTKILLSDHPEVIANMTLLMEPWIPELKIMIETKQNNVHHYTDVLHHTLDALKYSGTKDPMVAWALLLHDTGKPTCKTSDETGDHFKKHPAVSQKIAQRVLRKLHAPKKWMQVIPALVLRHDAFYAPNLKNIVKLRITLGWSDEQLHQLFEVQKGDILAHTTTERMEILNTFIEFYDQEKNKRPLKVSQLEINGNGIKEHTSLKAEQIGRALHELLIYAFYHPEFNHKEDLLKKLPAIEKQILEDGTKLRKDDIR